MQESRVAAVQFESRDNDKSHNLSRIESLAARAVEAEAQIVSFHEACIPDYSWIHYQVSQATPVRQSTPFCRK